MHLMHNNKIIHRNIKSENILIDNNDKLHLFNFDYCAKESENTKSSTLGTYEYLAPEIIQNLSYGREVDIWGLGVLLYELLHGESPFKTNVNGENKEIFKKNVKNKIRVKENLSDECKDLIKKMLTKDQNKRIKIEEIFAHPWIEKMQNPKHIDSKNIKPEIKKQFQEENKTEIDLSTQQNSIISNALSEKKKHKSKHVRSQSTLTGDSQQQSTYFNCINKTNTITELDRLSFALKQNKSKNNSPTKQETTKTPANTNFIVNMLNIFKCDFSS